MSCYVYQEKLNLFLKWSSVYVYKVIRTQLKLTIIIFDCFLMHSSYTTSRTCCTVPSWRVRSLAWTWVCWQITFHFYVWNHNSFTHQFAVSPICFHYISNIPLVQNMTVCWWCRFWVCLSALCGCLYKIYLSPQVFYFILFFVLSLFFHSSFFWTCVHLPCPLETQNQRG